MIDTSLIDMVSQFGALGVLIVGMFWTIQHVYQRMEKVLERNTQAFNELNKTLGEFKETLHEHNRKFEVLLEYVMREVKK